jgi:hypothetical protein
MVMHVHVFLLLSGMGSRYRAPRLCLLWLGRVAYYPDAHAKLGISTKQTKFALPKIAEDSAE